MTIFCSVLITTACATLAALALGRQCKQAVVFILGPAVFDRRVLAFYVARLIQAKTERLHKVREQVRRRGIEKTDQRQTRLPDRYPQMWCAVAWVDHARRLDGRDASRV